MYDQKKHINSPPVLLDIQVPRELHRERNNIVMLKEFMNSLGAKLKLMKIFPKLNLLITRKLDGIRKKEVVFKVCTTSGTKN